MFKVSRLTFSFMSAVRPRSNHFSKATMNKPLLAGLASLLLAVAIVHAAPARPNILWITAEDMSATLGCYGDTYATTPHIDAFAKESVRYTHAFASAPVCSPSRSCLITGCYAPSLGTQQMRSAFPIPKRMRGFPALLRQGGYYASNNVKTDYNNGNWREIIKASWDESSPSAHWRGQGGKDKPFFSIFNLMTSHQSRTMVWPYERFVAEVQSKLSPDEIHDPAKAPLPPYYVDTPVVRKTVARFYDCVTAMDKEVGAILKQLEDDGLADDTIVFFYSDHGSGMPRHKRALLDSGMHVPLMIRFPEKLQHFAPAQAGESIDRLVSFVDFGPTALSLANVDVPDEMQGAPFLGRQGGLPRRYVFGHRDRVDEVSDLARSVRDKRYLYIRNYMPHLSYNQPTAWPDLGEIRPEFYRLTDREKMTDAQWQFAGPTKPVEELYDCEKDPQNLSNLAGSQDHQIVLGQMRVAHRKHLRDTLDLGFIPESEAWKRLARKTPWDAARKGKIDLEPIHRAAAQVGVGSETDYFMNLGSRDSAVRYWGAVGLAASAELSGSSRGRLLMALKDKSHAVRVEAANALSRHGNLNAAMPTLIQALKSKDLNVVLHAARTIELLGAEARAAVPEMKKVVARADKIRPPDTPPTVVQSGEQDLAMFVSFAAKGFLSRVDGK
jgi:N-sulfoglucosamine sulfohydrolase